MKRLLAVNGHPDPRPERFCSALCDAYLQGAQSAGWETRRIDIGRLPLSAAQGTARGEPLRAEVVEVLDQLRWADRLAVVYPLWFDHPPQALRTLFARATESLGQRRAQLVVTMDIPAFVWRSTLRPGTAHASPAISLAGIVADDPVLIGSVSHISAEQRRAWLETVRACGESWAGASVPPSWTLASAIDRTMSHFGLG